MEVVSEDGDAIDVVVALSNDLARFGISTMLERLAAVRSLTSCKTGAEAIDHLANHPAHIVVLPCLEPQAGLGDLMALCERTGIKVLMLMEDSDHDCIDRVLVAVPDGFLLQSELTLHTLADTISRLVHGELPIPPAVARRLLTRAREGTRSTAPTSRRWRC